MVPLPAGRTVLRSLFLVVSALVLFCPELVLNSVLRAEHWARLISRHDPARYIPFLAAAHYYLVPVGLLCLAAAYGLIGGKPWARRAACAASCFLLPGFPVFTALGAIALYLLFAKPRRAAAPKPAAARRDPEPSKGEARNIEAFKARPFIAGLSAFCAFEAFALLCIHAQRAGFPAWNPGWKGWIYFAVFVALHVALHELGHAGMAWTLFFRVRVISIGPLCFWHDGYSIRVQLDWRSLREGTGYVRAAPVTEDNLQLRCLAVTAAGPMISLVTGLLLLLAFFALPGSGWERWWWMVAANAVLGLWDALTSLMPIGNSDGSMLRHLFLGTPEGERILGRVKLAMLCEQAARCHSNAEFAREVELREQVLHPAGNSGEPSRMARARAYQALGYARLACEDWTGAAGDFRKSLELAAGAEDGSALEAVAWAGLEEACIEQFQAREAADCAAAAIERLRRERHRMGPAVSHLLEARAHLRAGAFDAALEAASLSIGCLRNGKGPAMLRAVAHSVLAQAHFALGSVEQGRAEAREAAALLGSLAIPSADRNLALIELGELGEALWKWGETGMAIDLMRDAANSLEDRRAWEAAARCRISLARALRPLGRATEAVCALPDEEGLPAGLRRALKAERGELHLASGNSAEAIEEFRQLVAMWQAEPDPPAAEMAVAEGLLARALLEAADEPGNREEAAALARRASEVLEASGHPDAAGCRITLAIATRERSCAVFAAAIDSIESHPLLGRGEKAARVAFERARVERMGPVEGSAVWEEAVVAGEG